MRRICERVKWITICIENSKGKRREKIRLYREEKGFWNSKREIGEK